MKFWPYLAQNPIIYIFFQFINFGTRYGPIASVSAPAEPEVPKIAQIKFKSVKSAIWEEFNLKKRYPLEHSWRKKNAYTLYLGWQSLAYLSKYSCYNRPLRTKKSLPSRIQ